MIVKTIVPSIKERRETPKAVTSLKKPSQNATAETAAPKPPPKGAMQTKGKPKPAIAAKRAEQNVEPVAKLQGQQKSKSFATGSAFKEIAESLDAISSKEAKTRPALSLPAKIQSKAQLVSEDFAIDPTYGEFLVAFLQNALDLPEYGEVKAKIEINCFGRLIDCQILEAKSVKNAQFLKNRLPDLAFPCLNDFGILDTKQTFTITFRNVEIH